MDTDSGLVVTRGKRGQGELCKGKGGQIFGGRVGRKKGMRSLEEAHPKAFSTCRLYGSS